MKETTETFRTEKQTKKASKKLNKAKVLLGSVVVVVILAYLLNSIINLIKNPTDTFIVREGKISKEEAHCLHADGKLLLLLYEHRRRRQVLCGFLRGLR